MISMITAMEIATNYPLNIKIEAAKEKDADKYAGSMYLTRGGKIHKLMISTKASFDSEEEAKKNLHDICKAIVAKFEEPDD